MANETTLTIVGNLTEAPELRFTQAGAAVASFTVASTERLLDRESGQWRDGDALFLRCTAWRDLAQNASASLEKGSRVFVSGRLKQRSYQDREGVTRTVIELEVDEVGPSLRYATARVEKAGRREAGSSASAGDIGASGELTRAARDGGVADETPF